MKKAYILLLGLMIATPSYAYYGEYGYDMDYSTDTDDYGYENYGMDDVYEKTSYIKKSTTKQTKSVAERYIKTGGVMSSLIYKFDDGNDKYSTYGINAGFGVKVNNEITADVTATILSDVVNTEKNEKEEDLLMFSNKSVFLNASYNFSMGSDFTPYVTAGVGMIQRKIEGNRVNTNSRVKKQKKDTDGNYTGEFENDVSVIKEQAFSIKKEETGFGYQFGAGILIPLNNMVLDVNVKMQDFGRMKVKADMSDGTQAEDNAKITATTIGANIRVAI